MGFTFKRNCDTINENRGERMVVKITSKDELQAMAGKLKDVSAQLTSETASIIGNLSEMEDFDGINISQAATTIQSNLKSISGEMEMLALNFSNYATDIKNLDTYDFKVNEGTKDKFNWTSVNGDNVYSNNGDGNNNGSRSGSKSETLTSSYPVGSDNSNSVY